MAKTFRERTFTSLEAAEAALPDFCHFSRRQVIWRVTIPGQSPLWVIETDAYWAINNAARVRGFEASDLGNDSFRVTVPGGGAVEVTAPVRDRVKKIAEPIVQVAKARGYAATLLDSTNGGSLAELMPLVVEAEKHLAELKRRLSLILLR